MICSLRLRILRGIDHLPVAANDGTGCQARHIDMRFTQNVHHPLASSQKVVGDDPAVAPPPDSFGAHDHASLRRAAFSEPCQASREWRRQRIICVIAKAAYPPICVRRRLGGTRLSTQAAEVGDMLIANLPRRQRFGKALLIELRIGARPGHRSDVDNEANAGLSQEIDKFDDRPGRVAYGKKGIRVIAPPATTRDEPAPSSTLGACFLNRKRRLSTKCRVGRNSSPAQWLDFSAAQLSLPELLPWSAWA
jgi:hypothetical protein